MFPDCPAITSNLGFTLFQHLNIYISTLNLYHTWRDYCTLWTTVKGHRTSVLCQCHLIYVLHFNYLVLMLSPPSAVGDVMQARVVVPQWQGHQQFDHS